jgi:hypothetical protein
MVPDTALRLKAALKTLEDVITPLIPAPAKFAQEQLALIKKSIALVCAQIPQEYGFVVRDAQGYLELARAIAALLTSSDPQGAALQDSIAQAAAAVPAEVPNRPRLEAALRALKRDVENAVDTISSAPDPELRAKTARLVLDHSEQQTIRERVWVVATGFDPDPASLPTIEEVIFGRRNRAERS